jgi:hypothetical protein
VLLPYDPAKQKVKNYQDNMAGARNGNTHISSSMNKTSPPRGRKAWFKK